MQIVRNDFFNLKYKDGNYNFDSFYKEFYPWLKDTKYLRDFKLCLINEQYFKIKDIMDDIYLVATISCDVFGTKNEAKNWLVKPNEKFNGLSPIDACISGDAAKVLLLVKKLKK